MASFAILSAEALEMMDASDNYLIVLSAVLSQQNGAAGKL
jgi:hypothetical protein